MIASKAIQSECKGCIGMTQKHPEFDCTDECYLKDRAMRPVKRIREHCLVCADGVQGVKACNGITYTEGVQHICNLHDFRMGKEKPRGNADKLVEYQFGTEVSKC